MQRISVDLPEPEGPQTTTRSPEKTCIYVFENSKVTKPLADSRHLNDWFCSMLIHDEANP